MWNKIFNFFISDLYFQIVTVCFIASLLLIGICKIIEFLKERKDTKEFELLMIKYGLPADLCAPDYVAHHIATLIYLCEKHELDSLYDAQKKFDELFTVYWSEKHKIMEARLLQNPRTDENELVLRVARHGEAVERENNIEDKPHEEV